MQDRALVPADAIKLGREQLVSEGVPASDIDSKLIDLLVEKRYCKFEDITKLLSEEFNIPIVSLQDIRVDDEVLKLLPKETLRKYKVFPISMDGGQLELAISDPMDMDSVDDISHIINMSVDLRLANPDEIDKAIDEHFGINTGNVFGTAEGGDATDAVSAAAGIADEEAPIIKYVETLITEAVKRRASDIHLEPLEKRFRVRYRIDGVLIEVENPPKRLQPSIISRLKLMANISIAEKRVPQDGRIQISFDKKEIDLRVSSLPTVYGESIVMRILDKEGLRLGLPELGFFSDDQAVFERIVGMADGIFLVLARRVRVSRRPSIPRSTTSTTPTAKSSR